MAQGLKIILLVLVLGLFLSFYYKRFNIKIAEINECPFCFGEDYCENLKNNSIYFRTSSITDIINNYLSVKSVFITDDNAVFKKLGNPDEFKILHQNINLDYDYKSIVLNLLKNSFKSDVVNKFILCGNQDLFLNRVVEVNGGRTDKEFFKNIWTILSINVEPIILQLLKSENDWPVPKYYGACGRLIAEEYVGPSLNEFKNHNWFDRVYIADKLLQAAYNFTESHDLFRFYLTDVSPDNIAVDENLMPQFVDLENMIVTVKGEGKFIHESQDFNTGLSFIYSDRDVCGSSLSDHNYYSICKLLLSQDSPWPMMEGGLLHSLPENIVNKYPELHTLIDKCVKNDRFETIKKLNKLLKNILKENNYEFARSINKFINN